MKYFTHKHNTFEQFCIYPPYLSRDSYPCLYYITAGLLQFPLPWPPPILTQTSAAGPKCSCASFNWHQEARAHHTHSGLLALAPSYF